MLFNAHKKTISTLQATIAQQASLLDAIDRSMAVIEFDLQGTVLRANENFLKAMGYTADQVVGQSHRLFCTPVFARSAEYGQLWTQLRNGQFQSGTFERVTSDGQPIWLEASYNPVRDESGSVVKVVKYAMDVTPKMQAESEANAKLQAIDRAMAVIEFNLDGTIISANQNFLQRMGYNLAQVQGKHHRMFCTPELANSSAYSDFWRRLNQGELFNGQFERIDKKRPGGVAGSQLQPGVRRQRAPVQGGEIRLRRHGHGGETRGRRAKRHPGLSHLAANPGHRRKRRRGDPADRHRHA